MSFKKILTSVFCVILLIRQALCFSPLPSPSLTVPEAVGKADAIILGRAFEQPDGSYKVFVVRTLFGEPTQQISFVGSAYYRMGGRKDAFTSRLPPMTIYYLEKFQTSTATWRAMEPWFDEAETREKIDTHQDILGELARSESLENIQRLIDMRLNPGKYLRIPQEAGSGDFVQMLGLLFHNQKAAATDGTPRQTAVAQIKRDLASPEKWTVVHAIKALMTSSDKDAAAVAPLLKHAEPIVRQRADLYLQWCTKP